MKIAYLDCASGISGDMLLGALLDAGVPGATITARIDSLQLPGVHLEVETVRRKGFRGTKVHVRHEPEHAHRHLRDILAILDGSLLVDAERHLAERMFRRLAAAEAHVHGTSVEEVHFHEVGAVDSIVDIVGGCVGWHWLQPDRVVASPVPVGGGLVEIAHGRCRVPAPATAELLRGIPLAESPVDSELTTPTGAAFLSCLVDEFGPLPPLTIEAIGYGAGDRDFETHPNLLRLVVGSACSDVTNSVDSDHVTCLETNLDNTTGELIAHCAETLLAAGALDVWTVPMTMKKGRPAVQLSLLCHHTDRRDLETILFRETGTIGVRCHQVSRSKLRRQAVTVETGYGSVSGKLVQMPGGGHRFAAEYESCRALAAVHHASVREVMRAAEQSAQQVEESTGS